MNFQHSDSILLKLLLFTLIAFAPLVNAQELSIQSVEERDALFYQTLSILPVEKIPAQYRAEVKNTIPIKCATMQYMQAMHEIDRFTPEQRSVLTNAFSRPTLPFSYVSSNGRFRVHYTLTTFEAVNPADLNSNGTPDYVESVADFFEESYAYEIDVLNYRIPPDDENTDGAEYDVYIQGLGSGVYGFTTAELSANVEGEANVPSYIRVDNDFQNGQYTNGLPAVQVTAAHEYLHAIQFGYRFYFENEPFYYELCASWIEDVVYDDVNDYYASAPAYLREADKPFNQYRPGTLFNYGAAIWYHFLDEKYGRNDLVRRAWEIMGSGDLVLDAIKGSLRQIGSNFNSEFAEFAVWNYFTGSRTDALNFYEEGAEFGEIRFEGEYFFRNDTTLFDSTQTLSYKYYKFTTTEPGSYVITGGSEQKKDWQLAAIAIQQGQPNKIEIGDFGEELSLDSLAILSEIVVVPVHVKALEGVSHFTFNSTFGKYQINLFKRPEGEQGATFRKIFPNPFIIGQHQNQRFLFSPVIPIDFEINILDFNGRVVRTVSLANSEGTLRPSGFQWDGLDNGSYLWDGRNEEGDFVASGIYVMRLKQGANTNFVKFAVVNK